MLKPSLSQDSAVSCWHQASVKTVLYQADTKFHSRQCCMMLTSSLSQDSGILCEPAISQCCIMLTSSLSQDSAASCEPAIFSRDGAISRWPASFCQDSAVSCWHQASVKTALCHINQQSSVKTVLYYVDTKLQSRQRVPWMAHYRPLWLRVHSTRSALKWHRLYNLLHPSEYCHHSRG